MKMLALICQSEMPGIVGNWFLHPTQQTMDESDRIESTDSRGWSRDRATFTIGITGFGRLVRLRRDDSVASGGRALEGVFTCHIPGDTNTPVSVGIYYPSKSHVDLCDTSSYYGVIYIINAFVFGKYQFSYINNFMHFHAYTVSSVDVTINVLSSRQGTFTVTCTARGGTVVSSSLTGPGGVDLELQPLVSIVRTGRNIYSVTSGTLSGRSNGDTYHCTAAADLSSPYLSDSAVLRGMHNYTYYHIIIATCTYTYFLVVFVSIW